MYVYVLLTSERELGRSLGGIEIVAGEALVHAGVLPTHRRQVEAESGRRAQEAAVLGPLDAGHGVAGHRAVERGRTTHVHDRRFG